jgi:hypothetical protein
MANVFDRGNGEAIKLSDLSGDSIGALIAAISSDLGRFEETTTRGVLTACLSSDGPGKISDGQPQIVAEANAELVMIAWCTSRKNRRRPATPKRETIREKISEGHGLMPISPTGPLFFATSPPHYWVAGDRPPPVAGKSPCLDANARVRRTGYRAGEAIYF